MKKFSFSLIFLVVFAAGLIAQNNSSHAPAVRETTKLMNQGAKNCLEATLPETNEKVVNRMWKDLLKDYGGKPKSIKKAKEMLTAGIHISAISGGSMNVYHLIEEAGEDVNLSVWFELEGGNFLSASDHPSGYKEAEALIKKFGVEVKTEMVKQELEDEEKELKKLENELEKLARESDNLHKDIENYKKRIQEAEQKIEQNKNAQVTASKRIEEQKGVVHDVNKRLGEIQ